MTAVMIWYYTNTNVSLPSDIDSKEKYYKESDIGTKERTKKDNQSTSYR